MSNYGPDPIEIDIEKLKRLYYEEEKGTGQIAEIMDVSASTIRRRMKEHNLSRRSQEEGASVSNREPYVTYYCGSDGYMTWLDSISGHTFKVHRLLAIAIYGIEEVKGKDVHHKNGIRWDNRPENIELLTHEEHMQKHLEEVPNEERSGYFD